MRSDLSQAVLCFVLLLATLVPAGFAQPTPTPDADLNNDSLVDAQDLLLFQRQWHTGQRPPTMTPTPTPTATPTGNLPEITIDLPGGVTMDLVLIPAGSFTMGATDDSSWSWCYPCEQPQHEVNIGYDFYMGRTEITQAQWLAVMGSWPDQDPADSAYGHGDDYPAYFISWNDCQSFITALNQLNEGTFRLPSEAEWEYACRAGTTTRFYFGESDCIPIVCVTCELSSYGWWCGNTPAGSQPVGQLIPNDFGLFDMHGNVWEWCQDYWHDGYDNAPNNGSAWESPTSVYAVFRGGAWAFSAQSSRSANRFRDFLDSRDSYLGVRVVRTP